MCALALALNLWGIRRDLPYVHDYDEQPFVVNAYGMAVTDGWDPHWFGHPGSTMIYPLRIIDDCWITYVHGGDDYQRAAVFGPEVAFQSHSEEYFYLGRLLSIAYLVASVPVLYFMGRRLFGERVALWGSLLWIVIPQIVAQAQLTRTDTAILFFGFLVIDLLARYSEHPSQKLRLWIAASIACAISSHFKMACLGLLWLWTEWRVHRQKKIAEIPTRHLADVLLATGCCALVFLILNPFLFVHLETFRRNIASETPLQHPGADGFSPVGNLAWYLFQAIPCAFGWIPCAFALLGGVFVLSRGSFGQKLLPGFIALYLFGVIWSPLHWERWMTVILPALSFLAINAFFRLIDTVAAKYRRVLQIAGIALLLLPPLYNLIFQNIRNSSFNTRMQALQWVQQNIPKDSKIAYEWYTAPLARQPYHAVEIHALGVHADLKTYRVHGFQYLIVSSSMYDRFFADPKRYGVETAFYRELFAKGEPEVSFLPSSTVGGPEIRIYRMH